MNYHTIATPEDESIWAQIISLEGQSFRTARGLEYTYSIKRSRDTAPCWAKSSLREKRNL